MTKTKFQKIIIYAETTILRDKIRSYIPDATIVQAIKAGDLISAYNAQYDLAIIIDGNFDFTRSIWHKEILWVIDNDMTVIGCSSMGAIRASELDNYGMVGTGYVYQTYKQNITDDDSEVALNYYYYQNTIISTIPLINIRYTLEQLICQNKLTQTHFDDLFKLIKAIFYKRRTWSEIKKVISYQHYRLIKEHYIDIKYQDAIQCLTDFQSLISRQNTKLTDFKKNLFLQRLIHEVNKQHEFESIRLSLKKKAQSHTQINSININKNRQLELSKLTGLNHQLSHLAIDIIDKQNIDITDNGFNQSLTSFRLHNKLHKGEVFKKWCIDKELNFQIIEKTFTDFFILKRILIRIN